MKYLIVIVIFGLIALNVAGGFKDDMESATAKHHAQLAKI